MGAPHEDLKLLSLFHYILAGLTALFALLPLVYVAFGAFVLSAASGVPQGAHGEPPPRFLGWFLIALGAGFTLAGWAYAALVAVAGRKLAERRAWIFVMVMAGLSCAWMPFGTVLGVFTLVTLTRAEVKALFDARAAAPPAAWSPAPGGPPAFRG